MLFFCRDDLALMKQTLRKYAKRRFATLKQTNGKWRKHCAWANLFSLALLTLEQLARLFP